MSHLGLRVVFEPCVHLEQVVPGKASATNAAWKGSKPETFKPYF